MKESTKTSIRETANTDMFPVTFATVTFARAWMVFCFAILAMVTFFSPIWGLDPSIDAKDYLMDKWTLEEGLPAEDIRSLAQTPDNYLWIGTFGGLVRFDGVKMEKIDSGDKARTGNSYIMRLYVDREGALWISTYLGFTRYKDNHFRYYGQADGIPQKPVVSIYEDVNGRLLVSSYYDYIFSYNRETDTFDKFSGSKNSQGKGVHSIFQDSKGILWFSASTDGLFKYINDSFVKVPLNIPGGLTFSGDINENHKGELLVVTDKGLAVLNSNKKKTALFTAANCGLSQNRIKEILEDHDHNVWLGTHTGLNRMTENHAGKKQVQVILKNENIRCLFEDREKNLWVGTDSSGLIRFKNPVIKSYTTTDGLPDNHINSLLKDSAGTIWIGTNTQLSRYNNGAFETVSTGPGYQRNALVEDKSGNLWVAGVKGLSKNPGANTPFLTTKDGLVRTSISHLFCDSKNRLWIGTHNGINCYEKGKFTSFSTTDGLPHNFGSCFLEDTNQDILVATSNGLIRFPKGELTITGAQKYLPGVTASFILKDQDKPGVLWVGSYLDGLYRFSEGKWFSFKNAVGLQNKQLYMAMEDEYGCIWFSSDKGIIRVNKKELEDFAGGKTDWLTPTTFTQKDGMHRLLCSYSSLSSILKTGSGEFWFATKMGICVIDPSKIRIKKQPPSVLIEAVTVNGKNKPDLEKRKRLKDVKEIAIQFTAPTFISPGSTNFKYRLEGFEENWQTLSPDSPRTIRYLSLPAGSYRFKVIAGNRFGVWNMTGASVDFEIVPPYYATFWFWGIILLFATAGIGGGVMWFRKAYIRKPAPVSSYESTNLDPLESKKVLKKLKAIMEIEKIYRDDTLSLNTLAKKLHVSAHFLSQLINEQLGNSFYEMLNSYRIEEVKLRLTDPAEAEIPILTIAYDAGFSTKSSFNRYFKKFTGTTPSQFKKNPE